MQPCTAGASFNAVAGKRERRAGKTNQGNSIIETRASHSHTIHDEVEPIEPIEFVEAIHISRCAQWIMDHRPLTDGKLQIHAHGFKNWQ